MAHIPRILDNTFLSFQRKSTILSRDPGTVNALILPPLSAIPAKCLPSCRRGVSDVPRAVSTTPLLQPYRLRTVLMFFSSRS